LLQDALLDKHLATGTFDEEIRPIGRPVKSLLVKTQYNSMLFKYNLPQHYHWQ
jgi:lysophosphatidic acid acyltransferase/lysophosphatidylinositol acyltransferase